LSPHHIRRLCRCSAAGLSAFAVGWGAHCARFELPESSNTTATPVAEPPSTKHGLGLAVPTVGEFAALWNRQLRRPLVDPAPTAAAASTPAISPLQVRLVGTIVEPGRSAALLCSAAGPIELKQVGEQVANVARLEEVHVDRVVLVYLNQRHEVRLPQPKEQP
jgi:hypothetical protein